MIRAAIVGMGWWGRTLVEAVADSDQIRFVAGRDADGVAGGEGVQRERRHSRWSTATRRLLADTSIDAVVLATPHSLHAAQTIARRRWASTCSARSPSRCTRPMRKPRVAATDTAGVTLGLGYNRRFHPEMTKLRQQIQSGDLGTLLHFEATMTFPNALFLKPGRLARRQRRERLRWADADGRPRHRRMIDLGGPIEQVYCQSFHRVVPVDSDDTTSMLFRMKNGASGYLGTITATGPGFSFHGVWLEGLRQARGDDACGGRLVRGAPHAPLQHRQVSTDQGPGRGVGRRAPRCHARVPGGVCDRRPRVARRISFRRAR
jgi:hypothetical protein